LGAARIAPMALIRPARQVAEVEIAAIAARDRKRAEKFAAKHGVSRSFDSYDALLADDDLDAVYIPLPNGLHCEWTIKALEAGKHVLCEKPLASNAEEARQMAAAAERSGRALFEAFHYRYHPLARRVREILDSGELGRVRFVESIFCVPLPLPGDIRYRYDLGGGALMDTGCYAISVARMLAGEEPTVVAASATLSSPDVDRRMEAELRFPSGAGGRILCSLFSRTLLKAQASVRGDAGEMHILNPIAPHLMHRLKVRTAAGRRSERIPGDATYTHQLRAFAAAVLEDAPYVTGPDDSIANMSVIDAIYAAADLPLRGHV
jgi:predicted dehydrogenase